MESIYNNFLTELTQLENSYKTKISETNNIIKNKDKELLTYKNNIDIMDNEIHQLNKTIEDLKEEINNFNKVSLLRKLHIKYDKLNHKNTVLQKRINHYKNKLLKNNIHLDETIDLTNIPDDKDNEDKPKQKQKKVSINNKTTLKTEIIVKKEKIKDTIDLVKEKKNMVDSETEGKNEDEDFEEIDVELIKIKKRFYYSELSGGETIIYKAIKIKKGEYELGDKIGFLKNNKLIKD